MKLVPLFLNLSLLLSPLLFSENAKTNVALLGSSQSIDENNDGIHTSVLTRLLILVNEKKPEAVFFLGDMSLGLVKKEKERDLPEIVDNNKTNWSELGYVYDAQAYQRQLNEFFRIVKQTLKEKIPVYPVLGFHESLGLGSAALVKGLFNVLSQSSPLASSLAYTVGVENALFLVFSTTYFDPVENKVVQHDINSALLEWINTTLRDQKKKYDYLFAVSYEPAFSTTAVEGKYIGLDAVQDSRNALWKIFEENGVIAYFCTSEHLYDRTNRSGIWQIISGGAGSPLHKREFDKAFYHFISLSIPKTKGGIPRVQVYDSQGSLDDAFDLTSRQYPLYQLRISDLPPLSPAEGKSG